MSQFPKINVLPGDPETSIGAFNVVRIPPDGQWSGGLAFEFCIPDEERVRRVISAMVGHEDAYMIYDWLGEQLGRSGYTRPPKRPSSRSWTIFQQATSPWSENVCTNLRGPRRHHLSCRFRRRAGVRESKQTHLCEVLHRCDSRCQLDLGAQGRRASEVRTNQHGL